MDHDHTLQPHTMTHSGVTTPGGPMHAFSEACGCTACSHTRMMMHRAQMEVNPAMPVNWTNAKRVGVHPLDYIAPTDVQVSAMREVVSWLKPAWAAIVRECPPSAERTLALRALQEARARANEAILGITIPR